jgi:hypothetical protein
MPELLLQTLEAYAGTMLALWLAVRFVAWLVCLIVDTLQLSSVPYPPLSVTRMTEEFRDLWDVGPRH